MGQISSGIGLISGINTAQLIEQLLALESRPRQLVERRNSVLTAQQVAFQGINAKLLSLKLSVDAMANVRTFNAVTASSSDPAILTASAGSSAVPGSYDFVVDRLLTTQQMISRGFSDQDATPVGAGTLTFEFGEGRLDTDTSLSRLNGGAGVPRGRIRITDRSGISEIVDLSRATTVKDVLKAINNVSNVGVTARIENDRIVIEDHTGLDVKNLTVANLGGTGTATALGLAGSVAADTLTGAAINTVGSATSLADLNDGNGVRIRGGLADFRVALRNGATFNVDLSGALTLGEVITKINTATGGNATATFNDEGSGLKITDHTMGGAIFGFTALNGSRAAEDLGLLLTDTDDDGVIHGDRVIASLNSKLLKNLNGGAAGIAYVHRTGDAVLRGTTLLADLFGGAGLNTAGNSGEDLQIFARDTHATSYKIDLDALTTVQDLIDVFATKTGGRVTLSIEGNALRVTDNTGGAQNLRIQNFTSYQVAEQLGFAVNAPVSTVLGNDTDPPRDVFADVGVGQIDITNRAGVTTRVDLIDARSVSDVIERINAAGAGVTASLNSAGNGLAITDTSGGSGNLVIADDVGTLAGFLNIAGTFAGGTADSRNLQVRYISEATRLDALNGGKGINRGKFRITDSAGASAEVDLTQGDELTLAHVLAEINSRGLQINARINDTGDGILIQDTGPGTLALKIVEAGATTAKDLGILGEAANPGDHLDGSFEKTIEIDADDTLAEVMNKINNAGIDVRATIIHDGTATTPYRLNLLAANAGRTGAFVFDDGGLGMGVSTLVEAQNARVFFGSTDPASAIAINSATNSLSAVIPGATINLLAASETPVRVTVSQDTQGIVNAVKDFVAKFNEAIAALNQHDKYDAETKQRGLLLGDPTIARIRSGLFRMVSSSDGDLTTRYTSLSQVGITVGSGARLVLDETKLSAAINTDFNAVKQLFTFKETETDATEGTTKITAAGRGADLAELLRVFTLSSNGTISNRMETFTKQVEQNRKRIDQMNALLEVKRNRLQIQFNAMEKALAQMQRQGASLSNMQIISMNNNRTSNG